MMIRPFDRDALKESFQNAKPFPNMMIDNFLEEDFANEVLAAVPSFEEAKQKGKSFEAVNERGKVQMVDSAQFPEAVKKLNDVLASQSFRDDLAYITGIPQLLADDSLIGGGIHQTGPRGHLDVHVDFNKIKDQQRFRRLNILVYFNKGWKENWGGNVELWDKEVKVCHHSFSPIFNRCVVFETNEISYHGVTAVKCPEGNTRKSFAAYYYTAEAPVGWDGEFHSTVFKARPDEQLKGKVLMPLERARKSMKQSFTGVKQGIKKVIGK